MEPKQLDCASELLYELWQRGQKIDGLPAALQPATRAEGYQIQARLENRSAAKLFGWKIAATSTAGQAHIGVDGPMAGRIFADRVIGNHGACPLHGNSMRVAELEFAFRMAENILPRPQAYSTQEVMRRVASLHPAIELPDSRFERYQSVGAPQLIADNACAHDFLLGPPSTDAWRFMDLAAHAVWGTVNDAPARLGVGRNVLGDPRTALTWLVNELSCYGVRLRAGEIVSTGTCLVPLGIAVGDRVRGDFGILGQVAISIV